MSSKPSITYREYEKIRLGTPGSEWQLIKIMFRRSLGASTFSGFWKYWNPLFSYYLYFKCYKPLSKFLPRRPAVIITFMLSGAIHDLAASLVYGKVVVFLIFVFGCWGFLVVITELLGINFSNLSFKARAFAHSALIVLPAAVGIYIRSIL
ncbi:MAG TPA: MBOAT family O-acyltransferase [Ignavibacteriaceae bacterium]|nr:MBOAT family O-acyltransferase [Ignavibacteriaceae bacterium]